jgi:hypothetical protein
MWDANAPKTLSSLWRNPSCRSRLLRYPELGQMVPSISSVPPARIRTRCPIRHASQWAKASWVERDDDWSAVIYGARVMSHGGGGVCLAWGRTCVPTTVPQNKGLMKLLFVENPFIWNSIETTGIPRALADLLPSL